jgi:hypothetical protein
MFKLAAMPPFTRRAFLTALASISPCKVRPLALVDGPMAPYGCYPGDNGGIVYLDFPGSCPTDAPRFCGPSHIVDDGTFCGDECDDFATHMRALESMSDPEHIAHIVCGLWARAVECA